MIRTQQTKTQISLNRFSGRTESSVGAKSICLLCAQAQLEDPRTKIPGQFEKDLD